MANSTNKFYTREKTIGGVKYVAQFNGLSENFRAIDSSYISGSQNTSLEKLNSYILENVIVEPKGLTIDDFDDLETFNEVINFGHQVMQGKFRDKNEAADKKES